MISRRPHRRSRAAVAVLVAALVSVGAAAGAVRAQVLQQVPSDAVIVLKVNNLKVVSDKVARLAEALGVAEAMPEMKDPLSAMQQQMKIKQGFDTAGEMAFVVTNAAFADAAGGQGGAPGERGMMALLPVTDYKAFIGNLENAQTAGEITTFKPGESSPEMFVVNRGKYAVLTNDKAMLAQQAAGLRLPALAEREAKEKDAFVFFNVPALSERALPQLKARRGEMIAEIDAALGEDETGKQFAGVAKAAFGQAFVAAEQFLNDGTAAGVSLHLNDQGLATTVIADFKPDSYFGKIAGQVRNTDEPLIVGLPAGQYFAAGGAVNTPEVAGKVMSDLLDPITKELAATEQGKGFAGAVEAYKRWFTASKALSFGYRAPEGDLGAESIIQSVAVARGDAKALHDATTQVMQASTEIMKIAPKQEGAPQVGFTITPGGKTAGGVKLDSYTYNLAVDPNSPAAMQMQQFMGFAFGAEGQGMNGVYGAVNNDTFVMAQGTSDALLDQAVQAAQKPQDTISNSGPVKAVAGQLPRNRAAVEYIFVGTMVNTGIRYYKAFDPNFNMNFPADAPPIGVSFGTEGTAFRIDGFVPTELMKNVSSLVIMAQEAMQGRGPGAPPANDGGGI